jgi:hypothetical protein
LVTATIRIEDSLKARIAAADSVGKTVPWEGTRAYLAAKTRRENNRSTPTDPLRQRRFRTS